MLQQQMYGQHPPPPQGIHHVAAVPRHHQVGKDQPWLNNRPWEPPSDVSRPLRDNIASPASVASSRGLSPDAHYGIHYTPLAAINNLHPKVHDIRGDPLSGSSPGYGGSSVPLTPRQVQQYQHQQQASVAMQTTAELRPALQMRNTLTCNSSPDGSENGKVSLHEDGCGAEETGRDDTGRRKIPLDEASAHGSRDRMAEVQDGEDRKVQQVRKTRQGGAARGRRSLWSCFFGDARESDGEGGETDADGGKVNDLCQEVEMLRAHMRRMNKHLADTKRRLDVLEARESLETSRHQTCSTSQRLSEGGSAAAYSMPPTSARGVSRDDLERMIHQIVSAAQARPMHEGSGPRSSKNALLQASPKTSPPAPLLLRGNAQVHAQRLFRVARGGGEEVGEGWTEARVNRVDAKAETGQDKVQQEVPIVEWIKGAQVQAEPPKEGLRETVSDGPGEGCRESISVQDECVARRSNCDDGASLKVEEETNSVMKEGGKVDTPRLVDVGQCPHGCGFKGGSARAQVQGNHHAAPCPLSSSHLIVPGRQQQHKQKPSRGTEIPAELSSDGWGGACAVDEVDVVGGDDYTVIPDLQADSPPSMPQDVDREGGSRIACSPGKGGVGLSEEQAAVVSSPPKQRNRGTVPVSPSPPPRRTISLLPSVSSVQPSYQAPQAPLISLKSSSPSKFFDHHHGPAHEDNVTDYRAASPENHLEPLFTQEDLNAVMEEALRAEEVDARQMQHRDMLMAYYQGGEGGGGIQGMYPTEQGWKSSDLQDAVQHPRISNHGYYHPEPLQQPPGPPSAQYGHPSAAGAFLTPNPSSSWGQQPQPLPPARNPVPNANPLRYGSSNPYNAPLHNGYHSHSAQASPRVSIQVIHGIVPGGWDWGDQASQNQNESLNV